MRLQRTILKFNLMEKEKTNNRGGKRPNAGRKPVHTKQFSIWCKPENILKVRQFIKDNDF